MIDVQVFAKRVCLPPRGPDGKPEAAIPSASYRARDPKGTVVAVESWQRRAAPWRCAGRWCRACLPPEAERVGLPHFKVAPSGFRRYRLFCRPNSPTMVLTAPPPAWSASAVTISSRELHDFVNRVEDGGGTLAVLPDVLAGHRLAGIAADHDILETRLTKLGANPLLVGTFRKRRRSAA